MDVSLDDDDNWKKKMVLVSSDDEVTKEKSIKVNCQRNGLTSKLTTTTDTDKENQKSIVVSDSDGSEDLSLAFVKNHKEKCRIRILSSSSESSDEDVRQSTRPAKRKMKIKKTVRNNKHLRIRSPMSGSSDAEAIGDDETVRNTEETMKKPSRSEEVILPLELLPQVKGRKNIRRIKKFTDLDKGTRIAFQKEGTRKERLTKRHALRDKLLGEQFVCEASPSGDSVKKLVLDFDTRTRKEVIAVNPKLLRELKPQQRDGVQFMWDSCFESLERMKMHQNGEGGCILAHCMGLGKTLQVITLLQTLCCHEETNVKTILILTPATLILSWKAEFHKWLEDVDDWNNNRVYDLTETKDNYERAKQLMFWIQKGGVMIINYEMFRSLVNNETVTKNVQKTIKRTLHNPGPDLVICDEGHLLKNVETALSKAITKIRSSRRIILSGTPLQNNLIEYYNMVELVRPYLLGTPSEFRNRFVNPIRNGQYADSTPEDVMLMKKQTYLLHKILEGVVQRFDYDEMKSFLPDKNEFVISVRLSGKQRELYSYYLKHRPIIVEEDRQLFRDYQEMRLIWTHPLAMKFASVRRQNRVEKNGSRRRRRRRRSISDSGSGSDSSGESMKDFVVSEAESDESDDFNTSGQSTSSSDRNGKSQSTSSETSKLESTTSSDSDVITNRSRRKRGVFIESSDSDECSPLKPSTEVSKLESATSSDSDIITNRSRTKKCVIESSDSNNSDECSPPKPKPESTYKWWWSDWWRKFVTDEDLKDLQNGTKLPLLFAILRQCELLGDKILIFSQSRASLDMIEYFLTKNDEFPQRIRCDVNSRREPRDYLVGVWEKDLDYFRMDGDTPRKKRNDYCEIFNQPENKRARLFLLTSRTGGLGINLTAANRVIILDASWNPSYDKQAIFRICRFGQRKKCHIYRLLSHGTMESVLYERQIMKLSVARRVVDEHQVARHFTRDDLFDFYKFELPSESNGNLFVPPSFPNDDLIEDLLKHYPDLITGCHEHDSLLKDEDEEDLSEGEREATLKDYKDEKHAPVTSSEDERENHPAHKANRTRNPGYTPSNTFLDSNIHVEVNRSIDRKSIMEILKKLEQNADQDQLRTMFETLKQGLFDFYVSSAEEEFPEGIPRLDYGTQCKVDETKQYTLVQQLVARKGITALSPKGRATEEIDTLSTWRLLWNRWEKEPTEVEQLTKMEIIDFRTPKPKFSIVGRQVLVHLGFDVDRELKRRLESKGIDMIKIVPDFQTAEALLGFPMRGLLRQHLLEMKILSSVGVSDSTSQSDSESDESTSQSVVYLSESQSDSDIICCD